ncbi:rhodanese-like domain-containing protein [uncultured Desulfosarcina sp.]|uniref:rhodanese-like domain-containing protein n=1 Tax=uncultured Desulfosarcina sp. TaxID=218289 RepID=UPI0029C91A45|nr:rhodanese-like domain-containing protein [uncultured Desulfosarcina sp.]
MSNNRFKFKTWIAFLMVVLFCTSCAIVMAEGQAPRDPKKQTSIGKYITSKEAYEKWKAAPDKIKIIDCRTTEEYAFVGHAPMAFNIPSKLWTGKWDPEKKQYVMPDNPDFEVQAKAKFKPDEALAVMCRSGHRSSASIERLAKIGFTNVYNITDGFEGDMIKDEESYFNGKRMINGWKNSGAPWTYTLDPERVYIIPAQ